RAASWAALGFPASGAVRSGRHTRKVDRCSVGVGPRTRASGTTHGGDPVKASLFLAGAAHAVDGEAYALRIGLTSVAPGTPFAVGAIVEVPWVQAVDSHTMRLDLVDEDGVPFEFTTPAGETQGITIEGSGGTGIPAGHRVGSPRIITMVGNFVLPL